MSVVKLKIVEPSVEFTTDTNFPGALELAAAHCEECGRVSHKSEHRATEDSAIPFLRKIAVKMGHESLLEHFSVTVCFTMSRAASHQLVRHRLAAYCVTGDTEVVAYSKPGHCAKRWTLKQLHDWQGDPKRKGRLKLIRLRSVDDTGKIVPNRIEKVLDTGLQHVFDVTTRCNRRLRCTDNEPFLTRGGWRRLHELSVGDRILVNGSLAYKDENWLRYHYVDLNMTRQAVATLAGVSDPCIGTWIKRFGIKKDRSAYPNRQPGYGVIGMHGQSGRDAISERMTGSSNHRWLGESVKENSGRARANRHIEIDRCDCCDEKAVHRHHVDGNTLNNKPDNVVPLCARCHHSHHVGQAVFVVHETPITSILASGIERTFDIEMVGEPRNYVANGFVIHNTQESQRYCDYAGKSGNMLGIVVPESVWGECGESVRACDHVLWDPGAPHVISLAGDHGQALLTVSKNPGRFLAQQARAYHTYLLDRESGVPAEDARYSLPNCTKTDVYTTYNLRTWRHVLKLRTEKHAQWEIRNLMLEVLGWFKAGPLGPLFEDIG